MEKVTGLPLAPPVAVGMQVLPTTAGLGRVRREGDALGRDGLRYPVQAMLAPNFANWFFAAIPAPMLMTPMTKNPENRPNGTSMPGAVAPETTPNEFSHPRAPARSLRAVRKPSRKRNPVRLCSLFVEPLGSDWVTRLDSDPLCLCVPLLAKGLPFVVGRRVSAPNRDHPKPIATALQWGLQGVNALDLRC